MLLPREQTPWNCGYALGAYALKALRDKPADIQELQAHMSQVLGKSVSSTQVIAAISWLYLLDAVRLVEQGKLEICA